ncbi:conserved exported protein of unknown function [uncultured Sphingopyxis sp.]|uniref:Pectate lyase superfamily protein domain-containing protein n=1 Tax=uncultured Sphingopyxis sp. TaxID=310581 RepID=A0A1Y5PX99_9SPHN|nr:hypothetical protein [uncultured Sphingopyxis sp.]SBV34638.1 conserved exported protein of unknown function [uncultured Sphingopyxis sp.]
MVSVDWRARLISLLALGAALIFPVQAQPGKLPEILSDPATAAANPLPDFSYAGYGFGLAPIPADAGTVIAVTDHGAIPDDGLDDTKAVLRALAAANAVKGKVTLRFPKGRTQITEVLRITRSDIILDGAGDGPGGSELWFPRPLKLIDKSHDYDELREYLVREKKQQVEPEHNIDYLFTEYTWSGGMIYVAPEGSRPVSYDGSKDVRDPVLANGVAGKQFGRTLTIDDASKLKVGDVVQLQWFSVDGPKSRILKSLYGDTDLPIGSHHWTFPNRPVVAQATRVAAIRGKTVTLGDPLLHDVRADQPAVVADWRHLTNVGIQNLRLQFPEAPAFGHHLEQGYNGIYMTGVFDGWIRDLTIDRADSGILTDNAASLTISGITTTGDRRAHYSVHVGAVHNVLVKDLKVENPVVHPVSINTRSTRSVFLRSVVGRDAVIDQHSGSNHQNLFDQVELHIDPQQGKDGWHYQLWVGGGAPYWKPGHGLYNTLWNAKLVIPEKVPADATVTITSGLEGPGERIVGLHANRKIRVSYTPTPYIEGTGQAVDAVPSLYEYQLARRRR